MKKRRFLRAVAVLLVCALPLFALVGCTDGGGADPEETQASAKADKRIAFTFDDGPTNGVTEKILDKLESIGGRATFFQVANRHNYVSDEVYERIEELGCEIGSHTWSHPDGFSKLSAKATEEQLEKSISAIEGELSGKVTLFRPVGGNSTAEQREMAAKMGLHTVYWSIDTEDWREQTNKTENVEDFINEKVNHIVNKAKDGDIVLMHDIHEPTIVAAEDIIKGLQAKGFQLVTVSELYKYRQGEFGPGKVNYKMDVEEYNRILAQQAAASTENDTTSETEEDGSTTETDGNTTVEGNTNAPTN